MVDAAKAKQELDVGPTTTAPSFRSHLTSLAQQLKDRSKWVLKAALLKTPPGRAYFFRRDTQREDSRYLEWISRHDPSAEQLSEYRRASAQLTYKPVFSVILPVYEVKPEWLDQAIQSVREQAYPYLELCIADDASKNPLIRQVIERHAREDARVKVCFRTQNGHISESSNSALALASGDYIALLDHDDCLAPHALYEMALELNRDSSTDMIYSDEDKLDNLGKRCQPAFKPEWSPDYFLSFMYIGHLSVYRRRIVMDVGGFRKGMEGSQDYDLALRFTERTQRIRHIPKILYHWRMHLNSVASNIHAKPYAFNAGRRALTEAVLRRNEKYAAVENSRMLGIYRLQRELPAWPSVCVVITSESRSLSSRDVDRILKGIGKSVSEIVLAGAAVPAKDKYARAKILEGEAFVSRGEAWKKAIAETAAEYIALVDSDLHPRSELWLQELVSQAGRSGVAAAGPKIINQADRTLLCAGYSIAGEKVGNNFYGCALSDPGYGARMMCMHNVSALSSRCLVFRRSELREVGALALPYQSAVAQDVELSLSLASQGGRLLLTPFAEIGMPREAFEKLTDLSKFPADLTQLRARHKLATFKDPYFPRGLDMQNVEFRFPVEQ
ncbi:MAG: glycosyltransferase [Deltaproteobacteria bacterium]|nr:glycosyltransferase [Deltaproteobacteria bacterium]